jgi:hypothetical protein
LGSGIRRINDQCISTPLFVFKLLNLESTGLNYKHQLSIHLFIVILVKIVDY